ncbi:MAG: hypothetical protein QG614_19 [Patescibacteria group bacterium]|nr:hypothetical protein [Patescibacteria group bacterium]
MFTNGLKLKYLYYKTRVHQKIFRDGTFPFKFYDKLTEYTKDYNSKKALECGTAIGLTAAAIVLGNKDIQLDTLEKHERNINKSKSNIKKLFPKLQSRINFVQGRYFSILETGILKDKKYDFIFLDAYISRYNEVKFLSERLEAGGILAVSNLREHVPKSLEAKNFLLNGECFEFLELVDDTIFVKKITKNIEQ